MQTAEFVLQQESALLTTFTVRLNPSVWITDFSLLAQVFFIALKPLKQQSEVAPSACMIFPLHFRKCQ